MKKQNKTACHIVRLVFDGRQEHETWTWLQKQWGDQINATQ